FTEAYAVIPKGVMRDIVTSVLPFWESTRAWMLSRPLSGFSETFAQYLMEVGQGGGSEAPEPDPDAEGVLFVVGGQPRLVLDGTAHDLTPGSYAYLPPGAAWSLRNDAAEPARFHWSRKAYALRPGIALPPAFVTHESETTPAPMPGTEGAWATTRCCGGGDEAGGGPAAVPSGHRRRADRGLMCDEGLRERHGGEPVVRLAAPVEAGGLARVVAQAPGGARRQVGVAAGREIVGGA
ncbi:cupin domain-containing protein, partial [Methylobacterium sp. J-078]|uniref:cupin domain-containing protein n=1 Tax=Methylobacterium sp. J-078 TaxID=2836657 RepID=UPI001FBAC80E